MPAPLSAVECTAKATHIRELMLALKDAIAQDGRTNPGEMAAYAGIVLAGAELLAVAARARVVVGHAEEDMRMQGELTEAINLRTLAEGDSLRLRKELHEARAAKSEMSRQLARSREDLMALASKANEALARTEQREHYRAPHQGMLRADANTA